MISSRKVFVVIETSRGYGRQLLRGIAKYASLHGHWTFYRDTPTAFSRHEPYSKSILSRNIKSIKFDGVITRDVEKAEYLVKKNIPTIIAIEREGGFDAPRVEINHESIGCMAAEYFIDKGFKNFSFCGVDEFWSNKRSDSFSNRLKQAGFECSCYKAPVDNPKYKWTNEPIYISKWLQKLPKPVGIMASNDDMGQMLIESCKLSNIRVPDEVAILGVDNDDLICELADPPLSSINLDGQKAGYQAAAILDNLMKGVKVENNVVKVEPTHVEQRYSTDILWIDDEIVSRAIDFIRRNASSILSVDDVVTSLPYSRRSLERRFRKVLNRSISAEIRKARVEIITKMLVNTNKSITQIALEMNFKDPNHISRYFKQEKKISPKEYREKYGRI